MIIFEAQNILISSSVLNIFSRVISDFKTYHSRFASNDQELNEHRNSIDGPSTIIHDEHDSDETSYTTNGTRRIMREIIV